MQAAHHINRSPASAKLTGDLEYIQFITCFYLKSVSYDTGGGGGIGGGAFLTLIPAEKKTAVLINLTKVFIILLKRF